MSIEKVGEHNPKLYFRAFDIFNNVMHYEFEYMSVKDKGSIVFQSDITDFKWGEWPPETEYEVGQLLMMRNIMVKDKNGKPIYDLDIVKTSDGENIFLGVVVIGRNSGCPYVCECEKYGEREALTCYFDKKNAIFEVVGNIFENEDLAPKGLGRKKWEKK